MRPGTTWRAVDGEKFSRSSAAPGIAHPCQPTVRRPHRQTAFQQRQTGAVSSFREWIAARSKNLGAELHPENHRPFRYNIRLDHPHRPSSSPDPYCSTGTRLTWHRLADPLHILLHDGLENGVQSSLTHEAMLTLASEKHWSPYHPKWR